MFIDGLGQPAAGRGKIAGAAGPVAGWSPGLEDLVELRLQLRHDLEQVAADAVVGDLEDRGLHVMVDGDDTIAVIHPGQWLARPGDSEGVVRRWAHPPAGL